MPLIATSAPPEPLRTATWLGHLRAVRGYETVFRALGCTWFLILALVAAQRLLFDAMRSGDFTLTQWAGLLSGTLLVLFNLMLCWLILQRPPPASRNSGVLPSCIAFTATYLPWSIVLFKPAVTSAGLNIASALLLLIGLLLMVVVLSHLGRSFSIVPQARRLVRTGPYAVVRHPLYLVEEVALMGTMLQFLSAATLALFLAHIALQVCRMHFEDGLLRHTFPDFDDYARSTPRLIPYVW